MNIVIIVGQANQIHYIEGRQVVVPQVMLNWPLVNLYDIGNTRYYVIPNIFPNYYDHLSNHKIYI